MIKLRTLDSLTVKDKVVLCRVDLNVPMHHGHVEDNTRIQRIIPTLQHLIDQKAKVVVLSHFGRPNGEFRLDMSLAPLVDELSKALNGKEVKFSVDCIGQTAEDTIASLAPGDIALFENVRFYPGEKANDPEFVDQLAAHADIFINDAFSCSHRAHASVVGLAEKLPNAIGLAFEKEIEQLESTLATPKSPMMAIVGGSKVSTKLGLLEELVAKVDYLVIGGAMANTFLVAQGNNVGTSRVEEGLIDQASKILKLTQEKKCEIILPLDGVVAETLATHQPCKIVPVTEVPSDQMILDIGPETVNKIHTILTQCKTVVWNGPLGAFETCPFDTGTSSVARTIASLTNQNQLTSIAGGGDVLCALANTGLRDNFTYISTAGGAFLEWLQGIELPGIKAAQLESKSDKVKANS